MTLYTRRQLVLLLLLVVAAGVGLAVTHWRASSPDLAARLEQLDRAPAPLTRSSDDKARAWAPRRAPRPPDHRRAPEPSSRPSERPAPAEPAPPRAAPLDINQADAAALTRLPGVGGALAARIVEARETGGPFASVDDLRRIPRLRRATLERLRPLVTVTP